MPLVLWVITLSVLGGVARAFPFEAADKGHELLTRCNTAVDIAEGRITPTPTNAQDVGYCFGMMQGLRNLNQEYETLLEGKALFCLPRGINNGQAARVVVKYLKDHPEELHQPAVVLAITAFKDAYPCQSPLHR